VTALSGLVSHRKALWVASAMTEEDVAVSGESNAPVTIELDGISYDVLMVASNPTAYDRFYNVIANPILWFIQHYLGTSPMRRTSGRPRSMHGSRATRS